MSVFTGAVQVSETYIIYFKKITFVNKMYRPLEFIRKTAEKIFFITHSHKNQIPIRVSGFYFVSILLL